ncbi:MAG: hypothetical protein NC221_08305 [Duncaniella sp.]|nr:hypothetical protein [Muribaculum sp.]MCM1256106.1 hypothetical protein [Duncaniella sp.]
MKSTRCHAVIRNGSVFPNVIVIYPEHRKGVSTPTCHLPQLAIVPFEGEVHSTDDFNGIIAIVPVDFTPHSCLSIRADTFSSDIKQIAELLPHVDKEDIIKLLFLPL